jgi:hypothetical protein
MSILEGITSQMGGLEDYRFSTTRVGWANPARLSSGESQIAGLPVFAEDLQVFGDDQTTGKLALGAGTHLRKDVLDVPPGGALGDLTRSCRLRHGLPASEFHRDS